MSEQRVSKSRSNENMELLVVLSALAGVVAAVTLTLIKAFYW